MQATLLSPRRRALNLLLLTLYLVAPLVQWHGVALLRIDLDATTLQFFFQPIRIDEFFLVLLLVLLVTVLFLLMTAVLGRVWCGWLCPQSLLNDLVELVPERLKPLKLSPGMVRAATHLASVLLATALSLATIAYFVPLQAAVIRLFAPLQHPLLFGSFLVISLLLYLDAILIRRSFCRSYCPYGRMQATLMNDATLNLAFGEEVRQRCIRCNSCVRVCPMGVDIRTGFQIECINCGRCLDACRMVMARKDGTDGLISYRFGTDPGGRPRLSGPVLMLAGIALVLSLVLLVSLSGRTAASLAIQRNTTAHTRLQPNGTTLSAWNGVIENRGRQPMRYRLEVQGTGAERPRLLGQVEGLLVEPNRNRTINFFVHATAQPQLASRFELCLIDARGQIVARTRLPL